MRNLFNYIPLPTKISSERAGIRIDYSDNKWLHNTSISPYNILKNSKTIAKFTLAMLAIFAPRLVTGRSEDSTFTEDSYSSSDLEAQYPLTFLQADNTTAHILLNFYAKEPILNSWMNIRLQNEVIDSGACGTTLANNTFNGRFSYFASYLF